MRQQIRKEQKYVLKIKAASYPFAQPHSSFPTSKYVSSFLYILSEILHTHIWKNVI